MQTLINLAAGTLGIIAMVLISMMLLKQEFKNANEVFSTKKFFENEWLNIAISIVCILILAMTLNELLVLKPEWVQFTRCIFTLTGLLGSFALTYAFGKSKKYIRNIIDKKTNIADGIDDKPKN